MGRSATGHPLRVLTGEEEAARETLHRAASELTGSRTKAASRLAAEVNELAGSLPVLYVREGDRRDELLALLDEEPNISILVLGASTGKRGPGPLVSAMTGKFLGRLHIPVTVVPDSMTTEDIDAVT